MRDAKGASFRAETGQADGSADGPQPVDGLAEAERIVGFGVWEWELASGRVRWSEQLHRIYGLGPGEFAGTVDAFVERVHPDDRERVWANVARAIDTHEPFVFEERIVRPDGEQRTLLSQGRVIVGAGGEAVTLVGVCHDVTERARAEQALGASERRLRAIVDNTPSLITVKSLDGRYVMSNAESGNVLGIPAGELIGRECAEVFPPEIAGAQRSNDRLAAIGGVPVYDESVMERDGERRTYDTVTFVLRDEDGFPAETCTIATDVTERKERESERRERIAWADRIGAALQERRMLAYAQPVVSLERGEPVAQELLVRMRAPAGARAWPGAQGAILTPDRFLPAAERFGLVQAIDLWMVRQALAADPAQPPVHVNLSAVTMDDPAARRELTALLAAAPQAARRIVFEVTETAEPEHLDAVRAFAQDVADLGCALALDDFGVGFGSFTYLRALPLRYIKIDLSFVRAATCSRDDRRVVESIIGIARQFGLSTIAEGVEDQPTLELLRRLGVDCVQGWHLGRPAPWRDRRAAA